MSRDELVLNNVLCYIFAHRQDFSDNALSDCVKSFYSFEEIKTAKETIGVILGKEIIWRKEPDKKNKEVKDLLEFCKQYAGGNKRKLKFVSDSSRKMPPEGMEFLAPLLVNLSEGVARINELLPKILDIKSEVLNTADTLRNLRVETRELNLKCKKVMEKHQESESIASEIKSGSSASQENLISFRYEESKESSKQREEKESESIASGVKSRSSASQEKLISFRYEEPKESLKQREEKEARKTENIENVSYADMTKPKSKKYKKKYDYDDHQRNQEDIGYSVEEAMERQAKLLADCQSREKEKLEIDIQSHEDRKQEDNKVLENAWIKVDKRTEKKRRFGKTNLVAGTRLDNVCGSFRAAIRYFDVYVGRVHSDISEDGLLNYIKETFNIEKIKCEKLKLNFDSYGAFKVNIELKDLDNIMQKELWPQGIIIRKFYNNFGKEGKKL